MLKKLLLHLTPLLLAAIPPLGVAAPMQTADLLALYQIALERDPQLAIAAESLNATLELRPQARSALLPKVSVGVDLLYNDSPSNAPGSYTQPLTADITAKQGIYHRDALILKDESEIHIDQANTEYANALQGIIIRIASAYFDLLAAQDNLALAEAEKRAISQQLNQTKQRHQVGLSAITDVHEAQAGYDLVVAQEIAAGSGVDNAREKLREIIAEAPESIMPLGEDIPLVAPEPDNIDNWVKMALEQNLTLLASRKNVEAMRLATSRVAAANAPSVDLIAGYGYNDNLAFDSSNNSNNTTFIGLQMEMPLYTGGYNSSKVREATFMQRQAEERLEQQQRTTIRATRSAFLGVKTGISQVAAQRQALASVKVALSATQAGFEVGTRTTVDLLNSQKELFRVERDLSKARYTYLLATLNLKQAAGTLSEADLHEVNRFLRR
ncbi:MAG: TolC family outer membrane protein [Gammaproteobacteria bacterium]|nr:TolC family outer membrane protein [Gammaproteobacteria bacterium]